MKLSLRNKFLLPTLFMFTLGMGILTGVSYVNSKRAMEESITKQVAQIAASVQKSADFWLNQLATSMTALASKKGVQWAIQDTLIGKRVRNSVNTTMSEMMTQNYEIINLADHKGEIVCSSIPDVTHGLNVAESDFFKEAVKGQIYISDVVRSKFTGKPTFTIAVPVVQENHPPGVLYAVIDLTMFSKEIVHTVTVGKTGFAYIFQKNGQVISHPDKSKVLSFRIGTTEDDCGKQMLSEKEGIFRCNWEGKETIQACRKVQMTDWTVAVSVETQDLYANVKKTSMINLMLSVVLIVLVSILMYFMAETVVKPVTRVTNGLEDASNRLSDISGQISAIGRQLAQGTSKQAVSIEASASSLEQTASMTRMNRDNAESANNFMKNEAVPNFQTMEERMKQMRSAMEATVEAGEKTNKIADNIDNIAFQTNLLALNAAVEAAHAGESGAGFAVVASEVRNLALRVAESARETKRLIEDARNRIDEAMGHYELVMETMVKNIQLVEKVRHLVDEIFAASDEQNRGIEVTSSAVSEMEVVVQQNVDNAEKSAMASNEMDAQVKGMRGFVEELVLLVGKGSDHGKRPKRKPKQPKQLAMESKALMIHPDKS